MAGVAIEDTRAKIDQACQAGDEFRKLYYDTFDTKRHNGGEAMTASLQNSSNSGSGGMTIRRITGLDSEELPVEQLKGAGAKAFYHALIESNLQLVKEQLIHNPSLVNHIFIEDYIQFGHKGSAAIHVVSSIGIVEAVVLLIEYGGQADLQNKSGDTALHIACKHAHHKCVQLLLGYKNEMKDAVSKHGLTPLLKAIFRYQHEYKVRLYKTVSHLISAGCDVNICSALDISPLHLAVSNNDVILLKLLINAGANVNAVCKKGTTPLLDLLYVNCVKTACVKVLLDAGARVDSCNLVGRTPLHIAVSKNDFDTVLCLIRAGSDPNRIDHFEETPLWIAVQEDNISIATLLVEHGGNVNYCQIKTKTALVFISICKQSVRMLNMLVSFGASLFVEGFLGLSPLYYAVELQNLEIIKLLLRENCELGTLSNKLSPCNPQRPIQLAFKNGNKTVIKLLLLAGCAVEVLWLSPGNLPAALANNLELLDWILHYLHTPCSLAHLYNPGNDNNNVFRPCSCDLTLPTITSERLLLNTYFWLSQLLHKLYLTDASLLWNGNPVSGSAEIMKFIENLPSSEHIVDSLDCQPMIDAVSQGQITIIVTMYGTVRYLKKKHRSFNQNFMLTSQDNVWKIVSDCFRFQD